MSQLFLLYRLQQLDSETQDKKQRLAVVLKAQKENEPLLTARDRAEKERARLGKWRNQQRLLELELGSVNNKAKLSEDRLYSGVVKNPKELADLQKEIEALGRRRGVLEDQILETMLEVETAQSDYDTAGTHLQQVESEWQNRQIALQQEQMSLATRINDLLQLRQQQAAQIAPDLLAKYQDTGRRYGPIAVAALKNHVCQACGVGLSAINARAVQDGQFITCPSCHRILCFVA